MMRAVVQLLSVSVVFSQFGCMTDISGNTYSVGAVGAVNRAVEATVISKRTVDVSGSSETGAAVGATGGAIAGANAGGDSALGVVGGVVGGALVGGLVGGAAQKHNTKQEGFEYVVKTANGALFTVVQGPEPPIEKGQNVILLYGSKSRLIPSE